MKRKFRVNEVMIRVLLFFWLLYQGSWRKEPERFYNIRFPHRGADIFSAFDFISETFL